MNVPFKSAHLFERRLGSRGDNKIVTVGLLETEEAHVLHEDTPYLFAQKKGSLLHSDLEGPQKPFSITEVKGPWADKLNAAADYSKDDRYVKYPTVSEYLSLACWPSFFKENDIVTELNLTLFRVLNTEQLGRHIVFGIGSRPISSQHDEESWYRITPDEAINVEHPVTTRGSTVDQVLTMPVWEDSTGAKWSLSYNPSAALEMYDQLNKLALQLYKNEISSVAYEQALKIIEADNNFYMPCARKFGQEPEFLNYIALMQMHCPINTNRMMLSEADYYEKQAWSEKVYQMDPDEADSPDLLDQHNHSTPTPGG